MPPEPGKSCTTPDYIPRSSTVSSRVNVPLLLDLRKRKWSTWDEMLESPVDWIESFSNGKSRNGGNNGYTDHSRSSVNGDHDSEDELFQKETEVEECRTDEARIMTKLKRGVLEIGPTMSRLRSNTFSTCCLDRLVVMQCSCGEVVKKESYGTHHRMKHTLRNSAPGSPTTSNGSVPPSPLTLKPPPLSKHPSIPLKTTPSLPQFIKRSSPKLVTPLKNHITNNNIEEKLPKPRVTPASQVGSQDWRILSSTEGTKLRIVRINPTGQSSSSTTPPSIKTTRESVEKTNEIVNPMMTPLPAVCTATPSPSGSEERLVSPRDKRAAHREEIRHVRGPSIKRLRLSTPPVPSVAREVETTTSLPSTVGRQFHPSTVYQSMPSSSYPTQSIHRPSSDHPSSSLHPPSQSPLLISTSSSSGMGTSRYTLHSPAQMGGHHPSQQRPQTTLTYTKEHGQKMYLMQRGTTHMKRAIPMQHPHVQQSMQQGEGMGYGGNGGTHFVNQNSGQRQTIVIVLPPGARNRNGPIVLPPGTTLRTIPSGQSSSHHHGNQSIQSGIGPNGQPVHYISHTPLPPSTRRMEIGNASTMYGHPRLISTQQHPSPSSSHSSHHHQSQSSYHVNHHHQQQQHHLISSSTVPSYQYQMVHQGEGGYHSSTHSDQMTSSRVVMGGGGQPIYGVQRVINPGMQRVIEQRRMLHTPSPPPTLQPMPTLRAQLFEEGGTSQLRTTKKSASPSIVSSSTLDSPSQQPSSSTSGFKQDRQPVKSALMDMLSQDDSSRNGISREEVVSTGDGEEDEDETMPVLECHSTFNEESEQVGSVDEEMADSLEGCHSSTTFSTIPSSSTM